MGINIQRIWALKEALGRPLGFASKDGFARLKAIKGLEGLAGGLIGEALAMGPDGGVGERLRELGDVFRGFDSLSLEEKKGAVERGMEILGPSMDALLVREATRNMATLQRPLEGIRGIGPRLSERLAKKGLRTILDLLFFLPIRYEDRRGLLSIRELAAWGGGQVLST